MADLLGSILGSMQKPPSVGNDEKKKAKEQKLKIEKQQKADKQKLEDFREKMQKLIHEFIQDGNKKKYKFEIMDKVYRAIVHEVADVAGLTSFSFGLDETDRYVMVWKKEFAPSDDELLAYRRDEEWDPKKAKEEAKQKEIDRLADEEEAKHKRNTVPTSNYKDKYEHLIGKESAKDAAHEMITNKTFGFVPSENKRDHRTIEEVLAENKARKKLKLENAAAENSCAQPDKTASNNEASS